VTSKNGKTASVSIKNDIYLLCESRKNYIYIYMYILFYNGRASERNVQRILFFVIFQPVGFVTFQTRAGAEAAKQDLQVRFITYTNNDTVHYMCCAVISVIILYCYLFSLSKFFETSIETSTDANA